MQITCSVAFSRLLDRSTTDLQKFSVSIEHFRKVFKIWRCLLFVNISPSMDATVFTQAVEVLNFLPAIFIGTPKYRTALPTARRCNLAVCNDWAFLPSCKDERKDALCLSFLSRSVLGLGWHLFLGSWLFGGSFATGGHVWHISNERDKPITSGGREHSFP